MCFKNFIKKTFRNLFDLYLEDVRFNYDKEMEDIKHNYVIELERIRKRLNEELFITQLQYEKEFQIYQELWSFQVDCIMSYYNCANQVLEKVELDKEINELDFLESISSNLKETVNEFEKQSLKYKPFIDDKIYKEFRKISAHVASMMSAIDNSINFLKNDKEYLEKLQDDIRNEINQISDIKNQASDLIRDYLNSLKQ